MSKPRDPVRPASIPPELVGPGDAIRVVMTKWGERPHWEFDGVYLGEDDHGRWLGFPAGTHNARPGAAFVSSVGAVTLVPRDGAWLATFHDPGTWVEVYVDIATPAAWDGAVLRSVDLDLDVVRRADGTVYLDDEDEFAEHQVTLGYPPEIVTLAAAAGRDVLAAVRAGDPPYDGSARRWLDRLRTG